MSDTTLASVPAAPASGEPKLATAELDCLAPVYPLPRLELASGKGAWATDAAGRKYLDFTCGIAVNALGHVPPGLASRVSAQMRRLGHTSNLFANQPALELAQMLTRATSYDRVFFCNSGTEGIEAALKFARARANTLGLKGRDLVAFRGGFHGRTAYALAATWTPSYREPFEPLVPGVRFADLNDIAGLDRVLDDGVYAVIVEPVQGEGGALPASRSFLHALRDRTRALNAALICDEIQCGMGRCGYLMASEHFGIRGDLAVMSKALGGGLPLGAVLMTEEVAGSLKSGMHGCTFGGGAIAATAGQFMLERISKPAFLARVRRRAKRLTRGLESLVKSHSSLTEARGLGLLQAVEIAPEAGYDAPALVKAARAEGLLLVRGGERAVRVLPPLNVSDAEIDEGLAKLDRALQTLESAGGRTT